MYFDRNVFCFIFARGGSKVIPRKNVKKLHGKPLISYSILTAKNVKYIDEIFVSTEDEDIKQISLFYGVKVVDRLKELASDNANFLDSVKHIFTIIKSTRENNPIIIIMLPTSPIREIKHVEKCIELLEQDIDCVVSVGKVKYHPSKFLRKNEDDFVEFYSNEKKVPNRQQEETLYFGNGSIVVSDYAFLKSCKNQIMEGKTKGFFMDEKHSLDIDSEYEFHVCKKLLDER